MPTPTTQRPISTPWLTVVESAEYLGLCEATVRRLISRGDLPAVRAGCTSIRLHIEELDAWLRSQPVTEPVAHRDPLRNKRQTED